MSEIQWPMAQARLVKDGDVYLWIVDCCPLCGQKHVHGGGAAGGDPRTYLSHRVAHCIEDKEPGGYILVETPDGVTTLPF